MGCPGDDQISAIGGEDRLSGGPGNDAISASGTGNDVLIGGDGRDSLYAQFENTGGPQAFKGGGGNDLLQMEPTQVRRKRDTSIGVWDMATGTMTLKFDHRIRLTVSHINPAYLET